MAATVNPPRGMRDFLPGEKAKRERVLEVIRATYRAHGFDEIETPVMEDSERLHAGLGGDNEKLGFAVLKRGLAVEDLRAAADPLELADLGLRFDLTVPLARFYASHHSELPTVFRAIQIAPVWRAERPQKGRYRQFVQCDIDIIGEAGPLAEVELLSATAATLDAIGLKGCTLRINDRRLLIGALEALGFPAATHDEALITIDKLDKLGAEGVLAELRARNLPSAAVDALEAFLARGAGAGSPDSSPRFDAAAIASALPTGVDPLVIGELAALCEAVVSAGVDPATLEFDPFLVRGMGYYTGTIFEVAHPDFGYSLGGGGRYDGMIGRFLGNHVPAAGFSLGFERIVDLADAATGPEANTVALVYEGVAPAMLGALKTALIATGLRVRLERRPRNPKSMFESLEAAGVERYAFVTAETETIDDLEFTALG